MVLIIILIVMLNWNFNKNINYLSEMSSFCIFFIIKLFSDDVQNLIILSAILIIILIENVDNGINYNFYCNNLQSSDIINN